LKVETFYSVINGPVLKMDLKSAEMSKHVINAFLANCISFINEIGNLCEEIGADATMVSKSLTSESRIGNKLPLKAGLGFAGGTLARDLRILQKLHHNHKMQPRMVEAILETNYEQNIIALKKLQKTFGNISGLQVGVLGLTYKPGTDTLRRSSSIETISKLLDSGVSVKAFDPSIHQIDIFNGKKFGLVSDEYETARESDAILLLTEWPQFKQADYAKIHSLMKKPIFIDAKNFLDPSFMRKIGFNYLSVGHK
ncbi:MAG: UDP binding domain-containing protein, partial [Nitrosotalea sp.]